MLIFNRLNCGLIFCKARHASHFSEIPKVYALKKPDFFLNDASQMGVAIRIDLSGQTGSIDYVKSRLIAALLCNRLKLAAFGTFVFLNSTEMAGNPTENKDREYESRNP
jgi:hypothetical protein